MIGLEDMPNVDCLERDRLSQEYFVALDEQKRIKAALAALEESANVELVALGHKQADASIEQCYEAWRELNEHLYTHECGS
jgi:hypothetical protein